MIYRSWQIEDGAVELRHEHVPPTNSVRLYFVKFDLTETLVIAEDSDFEVSSHYVMAEHFAGTAETEELTLLAAVLTFGVVQGA